MVNDFKQEKRMIEKFKEKILASSEAVKCSQSAQSTVAPLITSSNNSKKLPAKMSLAVLMTPALLNINYIVLTTCLLIF